MLLVLPRSTKWQQGLHVLLILCKLHITFTCSSGKKICERIETVFLVPVQVRLLNLNNSFLPCPPPPSSMILWVLIKSQVTVDKDSRTQPLPS